MRAGADAVYLAGEQYGARAYAANFTKEELLTALREAHLFGKRIYLTVNTLTRESELPGLVEFVSDLVAEGNLDGVIVQDLGVLRALGKACPTLSLHASTQMSVTGAEAVRFLQEQGVCRVVPARELSLEEISTLRGETGIELETFIHGAMCYCYSGKCLFSSLIGGRSGNRGRCAQPCRLPYRILDEQGKAVGTETAKKGKKAWKEMPGETYPLSMKDLCTLDILPELIEAGISSFKIEGRMKKPEYAAGVTAIYRKYIDRYMTAKSEGKIRAWKVEPGDRQLLQKLYLRTDLNTGYYHQKNGPDMVTMGKPGYSGADEELLKEIRETYLNSGLKIPVQGEAYLQAGEPAKLHLKVSKSESLTLAVQVTGDEVQSAKSRPMEEAEVRKRLLKTGDTSFIFEDLKVTIQGQVFLPVASLNALRREGLQAMEEAVLRHNLVAMQQENETLQKATRQENESDAEKAAEKAVEKTVDETAEKAAEETTEETAVKTEAETVEKTDEDTIENAIENTREETLLSVTGKTQRIWAQTVNAIQWEIACMHPGVAGVIDDSGLFLAAGDDTGEEGKRWEAACSEKSLQSGENDGRSGEENRQPQRPLYLLGLPYVYRTFHHKWMEKAWQQLQEHSYDGVLVRTLEELQFLRERHYRGIMIADSGLYQWNRESRELLLSRCTDTIFPLELNRRELRQVFDQQPDKMETNMLQSHRQAQGILTVYGRLPMMITANCIKKTSARCDGTEGDFWTLTDRMGEKLPVRCFCGFCTNIIYNSVPLSLHGFGNDAFLKERRILLCSFTTEKEKEMKAVLDWYVGAVEKQDRQGWERPFPVAKYTTGHYKKGAE